MEQNGSAAVVTEAQSAILDSQMDGGQDTSIEGRGASFDDFDAMENSRQEYVSAKAKGKQHEEKQEQTKVRGKEEKTRLLKGPEKEQEPGSRSDNKEGTQQKVKPYLGIDGEEKYDVNPQMKLVVPVDGQKKEVTLRQLVDDYNGKVAYDKRFNELNLERKEHQKEKQVYQEQSAVFNKFVELSNQDPVKAIMYALDTGNIDPHTFLNKFREAFLGDIEAIADLHPDERQRYFLQKENEFLKERNRTFQERTKEEQALTATQKRIDQVRQSTGVTNEEFHTAYKKCLEIGEQKPSIERVADVALRSRAIGKTTSILNSIHPSLIKNPGVFEETWKHVMDKNFSDEEIVSVIRETLGVRAKQAIQQANPPRKQSRQTTSSNYDSGFFSDFDD